MKETTLYNQIVLGTLLPEKFWTPLSHFVQGWLRNYIAATLIYLISGVLWCFYIYHLKRNVYLPKDAIPSRKAMLLQIYVAMKAMPWYCVLPTISEYMVENGWTRCFSRISDIGWASYTWTGIPPSRRNTAGSASCYGSFSSAHTFHNTHRVVVHGSYLDGQHS